MIVMVPPEQVFSVLSTEVKNNPGIIKNNWSYMKAFSLQLCQQLLTMLKLTTLKHKHYISRLTIQKNSFNLSLDSFWQR